MERKRHICGICENANSPSLCAACVNRNLNEKYKLLIASKRDRDSLHERLDEKLKANSEALEQQRSILIHATKVGQLKKILRLKENQLCEEKSELEAKTKELNTKENLLAEASALLKEEKTKELKLYSDLICSVNSALTASQAELLQKQSVGTKQLCKIFTIGHVSDQKNRDEESSGEYYHNHICNVPVPRVLNPNSVTQQEFAVSLGYMQQLLNLVVRYQNAPSLLDFVFAGSCSRVWERASYFDSQTHQGYPLSFPRQNNSTHAIQECSSAFHVASALDTDLLKDMFKDVQKGIHLLEKAVGCVTAYGFNSFSIPFPTEISTFEAFGNILKCISSGDKDASTFIKETKFRCRRQGLLLEYSYPGISSSSLVTSPHSIPFPTEISNFEAFIKILKFMFSGDKDDASLLAETKFRRRTQRLLLETSEDRGILSSSLPESRLSIPSPADIATIDAFQKILEFFFSRDKDAATFIKETKFRCRRQGLLLEYSDPGISSSSLVTSPHSIPFPTAISTFEAFIKILKFMFSGDKDAAAFLKEIKLRCRRQGLLLESSDPEISSSGLQESEECKDQMLMDVGTGDGSCNEMSDMNPAKEDGREDIENLLMPPPAPLPEEDVEN